MKVKVILAAPLIMAMSSGLPGAVPPLPTSPDIVTPDSSDARAPDAPGVSPDRLPDPALSIRQAADVAPEDLLWHARPVVVFADTPEDPAFIEQLEQIRGRSDELAERDVVILLDANPAEPTAWRMRLRPRGFALVVVDKDGVVKVRKPLPWSGREIARAIDKFTMRRQEVGRARNRSPRSPGVITPPPEVIPQDEGVAVIE